MSESKNVKGTAFIIGEFRAEENEEEIPLYNDEIVKCFLNDETKKVANHVAQNFPAAKEMIKLRTKYFDEVLSNQISLGYKQVVILGSGLDTRAARKNVEGVVYQDLRNCHMRSLCQGTAFRSLDCCTSKERESVEDLP